MDKIASLHKELQALLVRLHEAANDRDDCAIGVIEIDHAISHVDDSVNELGKVITRFGGGESHG